MSRHAVYIDSERDSILIREGRVVVRVEAYGDRALLRHAGRITGERLRELYPSGKGPR